MRMKKTGILAGITAACICIAQTVPAFGAGQDLVGFVPNEEKQEEPQVKSYLTGENVPESIGRRRPVAVMMGNNSVGAPQSGIGHAGVVYEAPVEGNITRLMGILEDYGELERIGSVRSCRDYYLFYANEFNAIYAHYGQAAYALPYLEQHVIDNLNGIQIGKLAFFRTTDRKAPHNAYHPQVPYKYSPEMAVFPHLFLRKSKAHEPVRHCDRGPVPGSQPLPDAEA